MDALRGNAVSDRACSERQDLSNQRAKEGGDGGKKGRVKEQREGGNPRRAGMREDLLAIP